MRARGAARGHDRYQTFRANHFPKGLDVPALGQLPHHQDFRWRRKLERLRFIEGIARLRLGWKVNRDKPEESLGGSNAQKHDNSGGLPLGRRGRFQDLNRKCNERILKTTWFLGGEGISIWGGM